MQVPTTLAERPFFFASSLQEPRKGHSNDLNVPRHATYIHASEWALTCHSSRNHTVEDDVASTGDATAQ